MACSIAKHSLSDDQRFTRPYKETPYDTEFKARQASPQRTTLHANDNEPVKHAWPARDAALANKLMTGESREETAVLNAYAVVILGVVHDMCDATGSKATWMLHNGTGFGVESDAFGTGFGSDSVHDYGPTTDKLKELWEDGAIPSSTGQPWNLARYELAKLGTVGKELMVLRSAGKLLFNDLGAISSCDTDKDWLVSYEVRRRGSKGGRTPAQEPADLGLYTGAFLPKHGVDFLAGKVGPLRTDGDVTAPSDSAMNTGNRLAASAHDPIIVEGADTRAREAADDALARIRRLTGRLPFNALVDAASGMHMDELCGGRRHNKQDSARGRALLQVAVEILFERRCTENGLQNPIS